VFATVDNLVLGDGKLGFFLDQDSFASGCHHLL